MSLHATQRVSSWLGVPLRYISAFTLVAHTTCLVLILHYSRIMPPVGGFRYFPSTAVLLVEVLKLSASLTMSLYDLSLKQPNLTATALFSQLGTAVFCLDGWRMAPAALIGVLQNTFQLIALSNLDAATFLSTYQIQLVVAGALSFCVLGKAQSTRKWMVLLLLALGVTIIHFPHGPTSLERLRAGSSTSYHWPRTIEELSDLGNSAAKKLSKRSATYQGIEEDAALHFPRLDPFKGVVAALLAAFSSGALTVYLDHVVKEPVTDHNYIAGKPGKGTWIQNVQMSVFAIPIALMGGVVFVDGPQLARSGFFAGYNVVVWVAIFLQAFGGAAVAFMLGEIEKTNKSLASCISIVTSFLASSFLFELDLTFSYLLGTVVVIAGLWLDSTKEGKTRPPVIQVGEHEKSPAPSASPSPQVQSYFDLESAGPQRSPLSTPLRAEGLSTSRPGTPLEQRHQFRSASGRRKE